MLTYLGVYVSSPPRPTPACTVSHELWCLYIYCHACIWIYQNIQNTTYCSSVFKNYEKSFRMVLILHYRGMPVCWLANKFVVSALCLYALLYVTQCIKLQIPILGSIMSSRPKRQGSSVKYPRRFWVVLCPMFRMPITSKIHMLFPGPINARTRY